MLERRRADVKVSCVLTFKLKFVIILRLSITIVAFTKNYRPALRLLIPRASGFVPQGDGAELIKKVEDV
jgi:hypothetical protein